MRHGSRKHPDALRNPESHGDNIKLRVSLGTKGKRTVCLALVFVSFPKPQSVALRDKLQTTWLRFVSLVHA